MANTRIVLNKQSDLILTEAQIVAPVGIVEADIAGLVAHFQAVEQSIAQEVARATNEDAKHDNEIEAEESSRIAGDSSLESKINEHVGKLEDEDESLGERINNEESERVSADTSLEAKVSTEKDRIDAILLASDADKDSFAEIVSLINSVDTENDQAFASYVLSNNAAVSTEVAAREAADTSLEQELGEYIDSSIKTEAGQRSAADASLEQYIDESIKDEVSSREDGDAILDQKIEQEKSRAIAKDADHDNSIEELNNSISAEESTRLSVDEAIKAGVNAALVEIKDMIMYTIQQGMFSLQLQVDGDGVTTTFGTAINGSGAIYLNGLLQEEGVDYTLNSFLDDKGNPNAEFIFGVAPESGSSVTIYGQAGFVTDSGWYGDLTPLELNSNNNEA